MLIPLITLLLLNSCGKNTLPPIHKNISEATNELGSEGQISEEIIFQHALEGEDHIELPKAVRILEVTVRSNLLEELVPYYKEEIRHYHFRKLANGAVFQKSCPVRHSFLDSLKTLPINERQKSFTIDFNSQRRNPILSPVAEEIEITLQRDHIHLKNLTERQVPKELFNLEECKRQGLIPGDLVLDQFYPNLGIYHQKAGKKYLLEIAVKFNPEESSQGL